MLAFGIANGQLRLPSWKEWPVAERRVAPPVNLTTRESLVTAADAFSKALSDSAPLEIDFSSMHRISPSWGAVLSNVLASHVEQNTRLSVDFSAQSAVNAQLARAGIYFALARHPGLDWEHLEWSTRNTLKRWTHNWRMAEVEAPLFELADETVGTDRPDLFAKNLVAFLNPDRAPRAEAQDFQAAVVYPWLRELMRHQADFNPAEEHALHQQVSWLTWELLDNVAEHARLSRAANCSLATFATRGRRSLLHLCVMDTGVGIPSSLSARYPDRDEIELVQNAVQGELPLRGPGRGNGLSQIIDQLREQKGGKFFLASGPTKSGASLVVDHDVASGDPIVVDSVENLHMQGTVVLLTIPFGRPTRASEGDPLGKSHQEQGPQLWSRNGQT
jgi:hypothetical protein